MNDPEDIRIIRTDGPNGEEYYEIVMVDLNAERFVRPKYSGLDMMRALDLAKKQLTNLMALKPSAVTERQKTCCMGSYEG